MNKGIKIDFKLLNYIHVMRGSRGVGSPDHPLPLEIENVLNLHSQIIANMPRTPPSKHNCHSYPLKKKLWIRAYMYLYPIHLVTTNHEIHGKNLAVLHNLY